MSFLLVLTVMIRRHAFDFFKYALEIRLRRKRQVGRDLGDRSGRIDQKAAGFVDLGRGDEL